MEKTKVILLLFILSLLAGCSSTRVEFQASYSPVKDCDLVAKLSR